MDLPRVLVLRSPGTNCDLETAHAFELAGATVDRTHVNRLIEHPQILSDYQLLCIAGGFSYGDDLGAGRILAHQLRDALAGTLLAFRDQGHCILGICNGFQVLLQTGLLIPDNFGGSAQASLTLNDSGHYEDRWVHLEVSTSNSVFLSGIDRLYLPVAHAEGKFVVKDDRILQRLQQAGCVALTYANPPSAQSDLIDYPANPNGSMGHVAGLSDETGRVFGLMPHPERFVHRTQHPRWTRESLREAGDGLAIFQNAVRYFSASAART